MKKRLLFLMGLMVAGTFAYFGGYYLYTSNRPQIVLEEPEALQRGIALSEEMSVIEPREYYIAKIEQEMLMIYKMPEESLYDSLNMSSLQFQEKDYPQLMEGMVFRDLTEVFEFLESCMS